MNKLIAFVALIGATCSLFAAQNHVPASFDGTFAPIRADAGSRNHLLIVNVGKAIPDADWPLVVNYAASRIPVNVWTNAMDKLECGQFPTFPKSVATVFVVDDPKGPAELSAAGKWCRVSISAMKGDSPAAQTLRDRYAKMILRGMARACGSGTTIEPMCALFYGANTLEGMDKTNITISPMAYFPMVEVLRASGGDEATSNVPMDAAE